MPRFRRFVRPIIPLEQYTADGAQANILIVKLAQIVGGYSYLMHLVCPPC